MRWKRLDTFRGSWRNILRSGGIGPFLWMIRNRRRAWRRLKKFVKAGKTAFVTFNFIGLSGEESCKQPDGRSVWEAWDIPCYCIMVDHPFYYEKQLGGKISGLTAFCVDRGHAAYMHRFYPHIPCHFLPLAGNRLFAEKSKRAGNSAGGTETDAKGIAEIPYQERKYDISFIANYVPLEELKLHIENQPQEYVEFYYEIIEDLKRHPWQPVDETLEKYIKREIPEAKEGDIRSAQAGMMVIDLYIRSLYRQEVVRTLVDAGLQVHVFGRGWGKLQCARKENLIANGRMLTSAECVEIIRNTKIALNVMPWFKDGAHDRIFTAMLNGAVCLTDDSGYLREILRDKEDVYFYELPGTWSIPGERDGNTEDAAAEETLGRKAAGAAEVAKFLLEHPTEAEGIVKRGFNTAKENHTWKNRAADLEKFWINPEK